MQVFNKVVRAAVEDRLIAQNPVEKLAVPRIPPGRRCGSWPPEELWRLADVIDPRYRGLVLLGGYGGLRIGEMLALRWNTINTTDGRIGVTSTMTDLAGTISFGPPKTKAAVRTVTVPRFVISELTAVGSPLATDTLVFRSPQGHPLRPGLLRRRFWPPAVEQAG